jgi:hypothetical protein
MKAIKLQKHGVLKEYGVLVGNNNQVLRNEIKSGNSTNNLLLFNLINNSPTFINDVVISNEVIDKESIDITSITGHFDDSINTEYYAQFPLFFINKNIVKIPTKVEYVLRKYTPKKLLKEIHPNIDVAVDLF